MGKRAARPLTTRAGGAILFRGQVFGSEAELERALTEAVQAVAGRYYAGEPSPVARWTLTERGIGYVQAMREHAGEVA